MSYSETNDRREALDLATAKRLARLRTMPVELASLDRAIRREVGPPPASVGRQSTRRFGWFNPMRVAAASVLLFGLVAALVVGTATGPALASADRLAEIHLEVQKHGGAHACQVGSIAEANAALSGKAPGAPRLPDVPAEHVHFCCIQNLGRKPVSCAAVVIDGKPVTLAVAGARDVRLPRGDSRVVDGQKFFVESKGKLNIVMTESVGRWVCVMGDVSPEQLIDTARSLKP